MAFRAGPPNQPEFVEDPGTRQHFRVERGHVPVQAQFGELPTNLRQVPNMDRISITARGGQLGAIRAEENAPGRLLVRVLQACRFFAVGWVEEADNAAALAEAAR